MCKRKNLKYCKEQFFFVFDSKMNMLQDSIVTNQTKQQ